MCAEQEAVHIIKAAEDKAIQESKSSWRLQKGG